MSNSKLNRRQFVRGATAAVAAGVVSTKTVYAGRIPESPDLILKSEDRLPPQTVSSDTACDQVLINVRNCSCGIRSEFCRPRAIMFRNQRFRKGSADVRQGR